MSERPDEGEGMETDDAAAAAAARAIQRTQDRAAYRRRIREMAERAKRPIVPS